MEALIKFLRNQFSVGFFNGKLLNPKDISDPIVGAINDIPDSITIENAKEISDGIIEAQNETTQAVKDIAFPEQKEIDLQPLFDKFDELKSTIQEKELSVTVGETKIDVDTKGIISSVERLQKAVEASKETIEPQEIIDYTELLVEVIQNLERPGYDFSKIEKILDLISQKEFLLPLDEKGRVKVSFDGRIGNTGSRALSTSQEAMLRGVAPLSGASANGTQELSLSNTWYSIPSTVPASPYILTATFENNVGQIRWGFDNSGTPSATNGQKAKSTIVAKLSANQVIYYSSDIAGDDINWSTKII